MNIRNLAVSLGICFSMSYPAFAQNTSLSSDAPKPANGASAHTAVKLKTAAHIKKLAAPETTQKSAPATIPMDFSGMARRPVDLPSESAKPNDAKSSDTTINDGKISRAIKF